MPLQFGDDVEELVVNGGVLCPELVDGLGGTSTGHNIFALSVHEELAI